jgi:hypothetical protein
VYLENLFTAADVRKAHNYLPIESAGAQKRRIEHIWPVSGRHNDNAIINLKAIHFNKQLVQSLLPFIMTATETSATMTPDSINLVDEDDAG